MPKHKATIRITSVDTIYRINGLHLKNALKKADKTQAELAAACGYAGAARINHIIKGGDCTISGEPMKRLVKGLRAIGVAVRGLA